MYKTVTSQMVLYFYFTSKSFELLIYYSKLWDMHHKGSEQFTIVIYKEANLLLLTIKNIFLKISFEHVYI